MARFIGIRHRVKRTAEGEARPTMVAIKDGDAVAAYKLEDDTAELDFVLGRYPAAWRDLEKGEDPKKFLPHQVREQRRSGEKKIRVPVSFDGFKPGDTVAMTLGGSGDRLAYALSRRAEEIGAKILRMPPFVLKERRDNETKEDDHLTLTRLAEGAPELFQPVGPRDRALIQLREAYRARRYAQKDRIRCEQRLRQLVIGNIFLSSEGRYPEGLIEEIYDGERANDAVLQALLKEEKQREAELRAAVEQLDVWSKVLEPVEGCGPVIAAGIIASIGDIRRFRTDAKLKAYCGVHVLADGRIPRKRLGVVANWSGEARQALYQLGEQFVYRADSAWGRRLRQYKANLRARHPEPIEVGGKKRYTDGHIHKMAIWRTITRFVEWLHREWAALEERAR